MKMMEMMERKKNKIVIYNIEFAIALKNMGHTIMGVLPNPNRPDLSCWVFALDDTFDEDFNRIRTRYKEAKRNGR